MSTEIRFLLAIVLMLGVLVGTNILFPPVPSDEGVAVDSTAVVDTTGGGAAAGREADTAVTPSIPEAAGAEAAITPRAPEGTVAPEERVAVEGPLYRFVFSSYGARLMAAEMSSFQALNHGGVVDLIPPGADGYLGERLVAGRDTVDLSRVPFRVEPAEGLHLTEGGPAQTLRFIYEHPTSPFAFEIDYTFEADRYMIGVKGSVEGLERPLLLTNVGDGLAFSEADSANEARSMAYVYNHLQNGIESVTLSRAQPRIVEGPLLWTAVRSKFFVMALLAGESDGVDATDATGHLGGLIVRDSPLDARVQLTAAEAVTQQGSFAYRLYLGPQDYSRLASLGQGMDQVNPYGWKFFRPIVRPIVSIIMGILLFLHTRLSIGYGWVLIIFGVLMRVVLFPLNQKAMRAQLRNMAVQPLVQQIQAKYKDNPEKLQKEMMKLYKEHGFNPLAGCLPMLLPWPVLIALFFVFQNTIELRGVPFLWLPDLSARDPLYVLPIMLAVSMFLMQYVSMKTLDQPNSQMKMMMWMMPGMMLFIFLRLASGLNLYYATANLATIPQQIWINNERKKMRGKPPPKLSDD